MNTMTTWQAATTGTGAWAIVCGVGWGIAIVMAMFLHLLSPWVGSPALLGLVGAILTVIRQRRAIGHN